MSVEPRPFKIMKIPRTRGYAHAKLADVPCRPIRGYKLLTGIAGQTGVRREVVSHIIDLYHQEIIREFARRSEVKLGRLGTLRFKVRPSLYCYHPSKKRYGWTITRGNIVLFPSPELREQQMLLTDMFKLAHPAPPFDAPPDYVPTTDVEIEIKD